MAKRRNEDETEQQAGRKDSAVGARGYLAAASTKGTPRASAPPPSTTAVKRQARLDRVMTERAPLAQPGTEDARRIAKTIQQNSARRHQLRQTTAEAMATKTRGVNQVVGGPNPVGGAGEICFIEAVDAHRAGDVGAIVNPPPPPQPNEIGLTQWRDPCGKKDVGVRYRRKDGSTGIAGTTQVKVGSRNYIASEITKELGPRGKRGYGGVAAVDARFVEPDGSPRVAVDGFRTGQKKGIEAAGVKLCGVRDLEKNARMLVDDVEQFQVDGLGPVERERTVNLEAGLRAAYGRGAIASRAGTDAAVSAALHLAIETSAALARGERPDVKKLAKRTGVAAGKGTLPTVVDAGIYHGARLGGVAPGVASAVARRAVGPIFAAIATAYDIRDEHAAFKRGDITPAKAVGRAGAKTALNVGPLALALLGPWGVAGGIAINLFGRWAMG